MPIRMTGLCPNSKLTVRPGVFPVRAGFSFRRKTQACARNRKKWRVASTMRFLRHTERSLYP